MRASAQNFQSPKTVSCEHTTVGRDGPIEVKPLVALRVILGDHWPRKINSRTLMFLDILTTNLELILLLNHAIFKCDSVKESFHG